MKVRSFFLTVFLTICFSTIAQVDDFQGRIIQCLQMNGTISIYEQEFDNTLDLLYKQFETANAPGSFWVALQSDREKKVNDLIPDLAFAYRKHFSKKDINDMIDFYETEAAQEWLKTPNDLSEEHQNEVDSFLESETGKRMISKEIDLKKDMDEIARHWKRELFAEKMGTLVKNGYIPQQ